MRQKRSKIKKKHSERERGDRLRGKDRDGAEINSPKETKPKIDFVRRKCPGSQCSYVVLEGRHVVACTKVRYHAALLAWALAFEDILIDQKTMAFVSAVTGLLGLRGKQLRDALSGQRRR